MVWYGVWYGMVYGMVWCGVVWYGMCNPIIAAQLEERDCDDYMCDS